MKRISINGKNENVKYCLDCGEKLTFNEYRDSRVRCLRCRLAKHSRQKEKYIRNDGTNNIDEILISKAKER